MPSPLVCEKLSVGYGSTVIVRDIDFRVEPGEFTALIGANGAGKTTFLRTLLGLLRPVSGSVQVLGASPRSARGRLGYVPQKHLFHWDFPLSVQDTVMTGRLPTQGWFRRASRQDWRAVFESLERTDLMELRDRPIAQLSGGQRQRVLLARALACSPRLLLLDEPFTGVDAPTQSMLTELYHQLASEGVSIVMSTHDMLAARTSCSRIVGIRSTLALDGAVQDFSVEYLLSWLQSKEDQL